MPKTICLHGGWFSSPNVGDNAILLGIVDSLAKVTEAGVTVLCSDADRVSKEHGLTSVAPKRHPWQLFQSLRSAGALVYTGGAPFYDDAVNMSYCALLALVARLFGVPVIVYAIWLRPLQQWYSRALARFICRNACYLSGRDPLTIAGLSELVGGKLQVHFLPDAAISMEPMARDSARRLLDQEGGDPRKETIAICLRDFNARYEYQQEHFDQRFSAAQFDNYLQCVTDLVAAILRDTDCNVMFLPMHTIAPDDDRAPAEAIARRLAMPSAQQRVIVVRRQYGPREMKAILGLMKLVVGVRFHSLVLGSSMGTPILSISHAAKNEAIVKLVGQDSDVISLPQLTSEWLIEHAFAILEQRDSISSTIKQRYAEYRQTYVDELGHIAKILQAWAVKNPR